LGPIEEEEEEEEDQCCQSLHQLQGSFGCLIFSLNSGRRGVVYVIEFTKHTEKRYRGTEKSVCSQTHSTPV